MVAQPAPRDWDSLDDLVVEPSHLNRQIRDWHNADALGLARSAGQLFYAVGERELAALDAPAPGLANPQLGWDRANSRPVWSAAAVGGGLTYENLWEFTGGYRLTTTGRSFHTTGEAAGQGTAAAAGSHDLGIDTLSQTATFVIWLDGAQNGSSVAGWDAARGSAQPFYFPVSLLRNADVASAGGAAINGENPHWYLNVVGVHDSTPSFTDKSINFGMVVLKVAAGQTGAGDVFGFRLYEDPGGPYCYVYEVGLIS